MLVKLTSNTSGEMIMLAEHAHRLFHIIGKECTARGVFIAEQLPEAIEKLHRAVNDEKQAFSTTVIEGTVVKNMKINGVKLPNKR